MFNTDPIFVRAGQNGRAIPRGLSGVQHDWHDQPMLNFKSADPYATFSEMSRRASAAKEMQAALKAQIAAKRTIAKRAVTDDHDYAVRCRHRWEFRQRLTATLITDARSPHPKVRIYAYVVFG
jgi:hypothetical protein